MSDIGVVQVPDEEADYVAIGLAANFSNLEYIRLEARPLARDRRQHKFRYVTNSDYRQRGSEREDKADSSARRLAQSPGQ